MFKSLLVSGLLMLVSGISYAGTIKEGAVICISQKYLEKYERLVSFKEDVFVDDMLSRAQCVVKKKDLHAIKVGSSGEHHLKVEAINGFKVWVNSQDYSENGKNIKTVE